MPDPGKIKVLVMEREETLRHWLGRLLDRTEGFECVGYCPKVEDIQKEVTRLGPQILLLDWRSASALPGNFMLDIKQLNPNLCVVFMDLEEGPGYDRRARKAGADGFLSKARVPEGLESLRQRFFIKDANVPRAGA